MVNKSLVFVCFVVVLLVGIVYGAMTPVSSDGYNYNVEVYLEQGWNIVLMPDFNIERNILPNSEVKIDNIKAVYVYFPSKKSYFQAYPSYSEIEKILPELSADEKLRVAFGSAWVYSDRSGTFRYHRVDVPKHNEVELSKGWNFITVTPEFKGKRVREINGDCDIVKYAFWQFQKWEVFDDKTIKELVARERGKTDDIEGVNGLEDVMFGDSDSDVGRGVVLKVEDKCKLGSARINPPEIPN